MIWNGIPCRMTMHSFRIHDGQVPPTGGTVMDASGDFTLVFDDRRRLWLPVPQLDRAAIFHGGTSQIQWPIQLFWIQL